MDHFWKDRERKVLNFIVFALCAVLLSSCSGKKFEPDYRGTFTSGDFRYSIFSHWRDGRIYYILRIGPMDRVKAKISQNPIYGWQIGIALKGSDNAVVLQYTVDSLMGKAVRTDFEELTQNMKDFLWPDYRQSETLLSRMKGHIDEFLTGSQFSAKPKEEAEKPEVLEIRAWNECTEAQYRAGTQIALVL